MLLMRFFMLTELHLSRFKSFEKLDLPLRSLTVLTGVNGGGKSSVIQSLVLLQQTMVESEWSRSLLLNGNQLSLGQAGDVLNELTGGKDFKLGVSAKNCKIIWTFDAADRKALSIDLQEVMVNQAVIRKQDISAGSAVRWLLPTTSPSISAQKLSEATQSVITPLKCLSWISAERIGPRELLPFLDKNKHRSVGPKGEGVAGLLHWHEDEKVVSELQIENEPAWLHSQVRAWMRRFFPACDWRIQPIDGTNSISLRLRGDSRSDFHRPQNVGFGLTQLFPILVQLLASKPGSLLVIENPEVHLHPRAQQDIGELIAKAAQTGMQIILETHSDHVLNGIRLAVKRGMAAASVAVHFFTRMRDGGVHCESPQMDQDGRLDKWPPGFFDQFDYALSELL
jgi:predicted ATPase